MIILGLNAYHGDSSACLLVDGKLIAAAEEERFKRIKHWAGFPVESIKYCLQEADITLEDVAHVAVNSDPSANLFRKLWFAAARKPDLKLILERVRNAKRRASVLEELAIAFPGMKYRGDVRRVEHHMSHLSSAFHVSPYGEAAVASVDGFGDFSSAAWGIGSGGEIRIDKKVLFPHSMGAFYQALTQFIGFPNYGDEYKVMGLAPYGKPRFLDEMRKIVLLQNDGSFKLNMDYFVYHKEKVDYEWSGGSPYVGRLFSSELEQLLGKIREPGDELSQRHIDIARSVQEMYESAFFNMLNKIYENYQIDSLCLAGGCAMNSVANGKVSRKTPFKNVYVQSAAGDAGGAIGAAFVVNNYLNVSNKSFYMDHAYWGPSFGNDEIRKQLEYQKPALDIENCSMEYIQDEGELCEKTAAAISEGKVVGWFQGRMEWGPRALGNRSIIGDPRRADMKDILNKKIKRRESFRPFAPSILRESVSEWFEQDDDVPFMMKVFQVKENQRERIPAVVHVDGSGRLQTVYESSNPRYYALINAFKVLTGIPIVLNTSFNENEPVVCKPAEAIDCFLRTKMDVLVLGNWYLIRNQ